MTNILAFPVFYCGEAPGKTVAIPEHHFLYHVSDFGFTGIRTRPLTG